ncbi:MAG: hypothetical protein ACRYFR_20480 [Janthinobacterium lividum]
MFPARATLHYNYSPTSLFYAGCSVDGLNYILKLRTPLPRVGQPDKLPLQTRKLRETEVLTSAISFWGPSRSPGSPTGLFRPILFS